MYDIIKQRRWFYLFSALIIVPGLISMIMTLASYNSLVRLSIDFTGGTLWTLTLTKAAPPGEFVRILEANGFSGATVRTVENDTTYEVQTDSLTPTDKEKLLAAMTTAFGEAPKELAYRTVGPAISSQVTRAAFIAVIVASAAILLFIIFAFRNLSHPVRYGVCAVTAMIHDILVTLGFVSIMGWLAGWKADALTLTALLTIIAFSVQDTIVVFDRIRENTPKYRGDAFTTIANRSLLETLHRSLATQLCAMFMMVALLLFGGATIRQFIAVMFFGLISGTYSSIFNAVPILAGWEERDLFGTKKRPLAGA